MQTTTDLLQSLAIAAITSALALHLIWHNRRK